MVPTTIYGTDGPKTSVPVSRHESPGMQGRVEPVSVGEAARRDVLLEYQVPVEERVSED